MKRRRALAAIALLAPAGCADAPQDPTESDWKVTTVHDLVVEIVERTKIQILWSEDIKVREKFTAFPRTGSLWDRPEDLVAALRQVLLAHGLSFRELREGGIYKIAPAPRC